MISMAKKEKNTTQQPAKPCGGLMALMRGEITRENVVSVVGDRSVSSMPQVAAEFGLRSTSIKTWKANGMPGSEGSYPLADIVLWRIQYERENEKYTRPANSQTDRLRELDVKKKEIEIKELENSYLAKQGQMIPVQQAQAELYAHIALVKEGLLGVPRALAPMLPTRLAPDVVAECEKLIRHQLTALASGRVAGMNPAKIVSRVDELLAKYGMNGKDHK